MLHARARGIQYWTLAAVLLTPFLLGVIIRQSGKHGPLVEWVSFPLVAAMIAAWGAWCGLSAHRRKVRVIVGFSIAIICTYATVIDAPGRCITWRDLPELLGGCFLLGGLDAVLVFGVLEFLGLQVVHSRHRVANSAGQPESTGNFQVSIRGALLATAAIAVLVAGYGWMESPRDFLHIGTTIYATNCQMAALALGAIWLVFGNSHVLWRVAGSIAMVVVVCGWMWSEGLSALAYAWAPATAVCSALLLLPFRISGYQLARRGSC